MSNDKRNIVLPWWEAGFIIELIGEKENIKALLYDAMRPGDSGETSLNRIEEKASEHEVKTELWHSIWESE